MDRGVNMKSVPTKQARNMMETGVATSMVRLRDDGGRGNRYTLKDGFLYDRDRLWGNFDDFRSGLYWYME